jgi:hypothetical protein
MAVRIGSFLPYLEPGCQSISAFLHGFPCCVMTVRKLILMDAFARCAVEYGNVYSSLILWPRREQLQGEQDLSVLLH